MSEVLPPLLRGKAVLPTRILASSPPPTPPLKPGLGSSLRAAWSSTSCLGRIRSQSLHAPACPCFTLSAMTVLCPGLPATALPTAALQTLLKLE